MTISVLLFSTTRVLFVDGYDAKGNRIYDKVNGQTCHQCRQKTIGLRTACSRCESLQGVFCGDCLYMRYGENIEDALDDLSWICPNCRDICNCSFHRTRRGWAPTGTLYRRAVAEGYPSVAHYLVFNNLDPSIVEEAIEYMPPGVAEHFKEELSQKKTEKSNHIPLTEVSNNPKISNLIEQEDSKKENIIAQDNVEKASSELSPNLRKKKKVA